jgi:hypothetical protein
MYGNARSSGDRMTENHGAKSMMSSHGYAGNSPPGTGRILNIMGTAQPAGIRPREKYRNYLKEKIRIIS